MIKKLFLISSLSLFATVFAQSHTVAKGDNPYSISKKYGLSVEELTTMNPSIKNGQLQIGDVLKVGKKGTTTAAKPSKTTTGKIVLQPKQTIYGITKQYHISEADLRKLNPDLDANMKVGSEIILPADNISKYADAAAVAPKPVVEKATEAIKTVEGDYYEVQPKDNYYKLSKQLGLSQKELFALNPDLEAKGLQVGDKIKISKTAASTKDVAKIDKVTTPSKVDSQVTSQEDYVTYTVKDGDTVFGIVSRYGISIDDLMNLNPQLSSGLKSGMVLKIKKVDEGYVKKSGDELNVVMMMPFGFKSNDSKYRSMATDFLSGAKLAIERNAKKGQKLDIKIIDSGSEADFKNAMTQINQDNTDLIIGPFFKSNLVDMLTLVGPKKIPVVAPFANSEELYDYSNLIIVETSDSVYADRIAKEVEEVYSDQKIYILADKSKDMANYLKSILERKLKKAEVVIVTSAAELKLEQNMMTGNPAPIIAVNANSTDSVAESFAEKLISLSQSAKGIKAFSMYSTPMFEKKAQDLGQVSLVYLMDRTINTEGSFEKQILAEYKAKYCKTPPRYAIIGFDVMNDMLSRENKKGEILKQMSKVQTQLATKFEFVRAKSNGAYVNTGYRVVSLVP